MLDKWEIEARAAIPRGYGRVIAGEILADDLVWSWTSKEWLRQDDTSWLHHHLLAEDCVCVVRRPKADVRGFTQQRTFTIQKPPAVPAAIEREICQDSLFD